MINFIILSNTKSQKHFDMTKSLIDSLTNTIFPTTDKTKLDTYRIIIVETQQNFKYNLPNVTTITYDVTKYNYFNYNYAVNQGLKYCYNTFTDNDWFCILNNDVIVTNTWLLEIEKAVLADNELDSICPNINTVTDGVNYGYALWIHLDGCCILAKKSVYDKIGFLDEDFVFYFQDDDYLEQLRRYNIKHGKVMSSKITHLGAQTMPENDTIRPLLFYCRDIFIKKYGIDTYIQRENEKRAK